MRKKPTLEDLSRRLKAKEKLVPLRQEDPSSWRVGIDFVAGVVIGIALGLFLDHTFNWSPWGLITFFILGSGAGFLNVYRSIKKLGYHTGYPEQKDEKQHGKPSQTIHPRNDRSSLF